VIVDCFPFFQELDLLELRLRTLDSIVDRFVISEALTTHTGLPKPLYFSEHRERFARWNDRIIHLVDREQPDAEAWINEWRQRDLLATALTDLDPDDLVVMGDVDEIPAPELLAVRPAPGELVIFEQVLSLYAVNLRRRDLWLGTRAFRAGDFSRWGSMHAIRMITDNATVARNGGWHLTYLGDRETTLIKLQATPHVEYGIPYYRDTWRIDVVVSAGRHIADPDDVLSWSPIDETFPTPLREDPERWRDLVAERPPNAADVNAQAHAHGTFAYVPDDADAVAVLSDAPECWSATGAQRFAERFTGASFAFESLSGMLRGRARPCVVVDGLERHRPAAFLANLAADSPAATVVAVTKNSRSFAVLGEVVGGAPFPRGLALGDIELEGLFAEARFTVVRMDLLPRKDFWVWIHALPDSLGLQVGRVAVYAIPRERIAKFAAVAYVTLARATPRSEPLPSEARNA
jgi:beta-1,4-mannosyl-glycoprotein beta-1,4-N-acetylglucosaminyltransferase